MTVGDSARTLLARSRLRWAAKASPSTTLIAVVGNCQAAPLARELSSGIWGNSTKVIALPAVHEITPADLPAIRQVLARANVLVTHQVKEDYRGLPIGTAQLVELLPRTATLLTVPVLYYEGQLPFQVYVRRAGFDLSESLPITSYADARTLVAVSRGYSIAETVDFVSAWETPKEAVVANHERSLAELGKRERSLDVAISGVLARNLTAERMFFTVNHPTTAALRLVADEVLDVLNVEPGTSRPHQAQLDHLVTPVEPHVARALSIEFESTDDWICDGRLISARTVIEAHYRWFVANREVVDGALAEHAARLRLLSLA